jgi:hypothetical protein
MRRRLATGVCFQMKHSLWAKADPFHYNGKRLCSDHGRGARPYAQPPQGRMHNGKFRVTDRSYQDLSKACQRVVQAPREPCCHCDVQ